MEQLAAKKKLKREVSPEHYAIKAHADTNHMYDTYLPYEYHLRMVSKIIADNIRLIPEADRADVIAAGWLHDVIEDARISYNDVLKTFNFNVAEIVRACTNYGRGRTKEDRMPDFCYKDIRETPNATYVKLADRMANVQYSIMTGSGMLLKYKQAHTRFSKELRNGEYESMWEELETLFNTKVKKAK